MPEKQRAWRAISRKQDDVARVQEGTRSRFSSASPWDSHRAGWLARQPH